MDSATPIRMAILGTGSMAAKHAENFGAIDGVELVAGIDIDQERLKEFCDQFRIQNRFASLDDALNWGEFDCVSNITPDDAHYETTLKCISAGKDVFCEKPLASSHQQAIEMTNAAQTAGRVAMVNLTYRNVPALHRAHTMVVGGEIGSVYHLEASYLQSWLASRHWGDWRTESRWLWRLSKDHGSNGVLGDIGIHILDFAAYGVGSDIASMQCRSKAFDKAPNGQIGDYKLDANDSFVMLVEFENGALGTIHASRWASGHSNDIRLRLFGSKGGLDIQHGGRDENGQQISRLMACLGEDLESQTWKEIPLDPVHTNYERFIEAIRRRETLEPSFAHATKLQALLDEALEQGA